VSGSDVVRYDESVRAGEERAGAHPRCRIGCTECCIGVFDIAAPGAERLRRGLRELERERPAEARDTLCSELSHLPCAVLDPGTGACLLYRFRPLTCRSYGLPVKFGDETLPPCTLNFERAPKEDVALATIEPDREDLEGEILDVMPRPGDTVIAGALALRRRSRSRPARRRGARRPGEGRGAERVFSPLQWHFADTTLSRGDAN
jgi:Fe-S-cluster containining protein